MQICVHDHVEVHPQKEKEVLYFVKKKPGRNRRVESSAVRIRVGLSLMLSSKMYVYGITKNRLEIYWALIILTNLSVLQELDFIIGETQFAFFLKHQLNSSKNNGPRIY